MTIIDAHAHLGECRIYGANVTEEQLISTMDSNGIQISVVQPFPGAPYPERCHDEIARVSARHPGRILGMVNLNPHVGRHAYAREVARCVTELSFIALKIHTVAHAVFPNSGPAFMVAELAGEYGLPVMLHTGNGVPFALPSLVIPLSRAFPAVTFVLAHAGFGIYTGEAQVVAIECPNVVLETSWCLAPDVAWLVQTVGADRVMMGADLPSNVPVELAKFRNLGLSPSDMEKCLCGTARRVFGMEK